jgi:S1-C subfamily serine protease
MVRCALFLGASLFLALLFLDASPYRQVGGRDLEFRRDSIPSDVFSPIATQSTTSTSEKFRTPTTSVEIYDEGEKVFTTAQKTNEATEKPVFSSSTFPRLTSPRNPPNETTSPPSLQPEILNEKARSALVNILCEASSPLRSTSGSGVFVDSRGIILTNAHIAQYFLLEGTPISVSCTIRSGSPARAAWHAKLVFIPEKWVNKHAKDIVASHATGTGEHDYAFLAITSSVDGSPLPASFPSVSMNFEEAASVTGDPVLIAGYPAEFVGGSAARNTLHASTVFSNIKQLLTFTEGIVDVISVGGTVLAQSGSSGGGFIDLFGSLVGIIVTTSIGDTTGSRDLHAITPAHINRSMREHTGVSTQPFLSLDITALLSSFQQKETGLSKVILSAIESQQD